MYKNWIHQTDSERKSDSTRDKAKQKKINQEKKREDDPSTQRLNNTLKLGVFKRKNIVFYSEVRRFENWMGKHVKIFTSITPAMNAAREKNKR
jgi:hypothetical protein